MPFWQMAIVMLQDPVDGSSLTFPTAPQEVTSEAGTEAAHIQLDNFGTLSRAIGRPPTTYEFKAIFYGGTRFAGRYTGPTRQPGVAWSPDLEPWGPGFIMQPSWRPPADIRYQLERWHDTQPRRPALQPLELTVFAEGFPRIYKPVYIESLKFTWKGAHGDLECDLGLTEWRAAVVGLDEGGDSDEQDAAEVGELQEDEPPIPITVNVQPGDSLWAIAQLHLGDGARYPEIYELNQDVIGANPNLIYPGQVLVLPGGQAEPEEPADQPVAQPLEAFTQSMPNFGNPQLPMPARRVRRWL